MVKEIRNIFIGYFFFKMKQNMNSEVAFHNLDLEIYSINKTKQLYNRLFIGQGNETISIIKIGVSAKIMVARNEKSRIKLVRLPILRPLLLKRG